ncbi:MAG: outer membrane lipoprotein chaperone LolA [Deltaproteobacteria bacterium]|nr:outer membrane lipoprotein chaperone LolA [Deltaproteobacteria bacterium]
MQEKLKNSFLGKLLAALLLKFPPLKKGGQIITAAVLAAFALTAQLHSAEPSADAIVDALQKNYDATGDFVADFSQETAVKTLNRSLKASGKITYKRPGKMLWRYEEPKGQFVLADGKHLYFFQPEQNQVIKSPLKNAFRGDIPLSFLLGLGNLKKDFNAALQSSEGNQYTLRLEPKGEAGGYSEILISVNKNSFDIQSVSVRDAASNVTTLRFAAMQKGTGVKDSLFQFQVPAGADVVELGQ